MPTDSPITSPLGILDSIGPKYALAIGLGLETIVRDCYGFVVADYEAGDEIYIFGFSPRTAKPDRSTRHQLSDRVSANTNNTRAVLHYLQMEGKAHPTAGEFQ